MTVAVLVSLLAGAWVGIAPQQEASAAKVQKDRRIEPRAEATLQQMSDRLAELKRFAFEAEETFDEVPDGQPRVALSNLRHVAVVRPNRVAADATGDTLNRAFWYDGETATVLDKAHNTFGRFELPDTIDAALGYRFPKRWGSFVIEGRNLNNEKFEFYERAIQERVIPDRAVGARLERTTGTDAFTRVSHGNAAGNAPRVRTGPAGASGQTISHCRGRLQTAAPSTRRRAWQPVWQ